MRTTISKENVLKSSFLFLTFTAFILSALLFTSCSESEGISGTDDTALIAKIETASKTTVEATSLPSAISAAFNGDLSDSFVENVELAAGLGFKVAIDTDNAAREEGKSEVFFSVEGRQLTDHRAKIKKRRNKCFEFVFPVDFIMPDNSSITLNEKADWVLIRQWYEANPDSTERAAIVFPLDVTLEDGTVQTILDIDELKEIKNSCKKGKDKRKCFRLILPVSFTMPDAAVIEVTKRAEFRLVRKWYKENPDATERGTLNYPVNIMYKDATTATINDATEMHAAKEACK